MPALTRSRQEVSRFLETGTPAGALPRGSFTGAHAGMAPVELARSLPDARDIVEDLTKRNVQLSTLVKDSEGRSRPHR
jgi:hypothetical protein